MVVEGLRKCLWEKDQPLVAREFFEYALWLKADERALSRCQAAQAEGVVAEDS